ncbi:chemotaxis protein CheB [Xanthobacter flavus]|uniref:chemotaxis protein CheB n=1 Tax=Xanthobacter flavus TaxID=281 RepID=UPI00372CF062
MPKLPSRAARSTAPRSRERSAGGATASHRPQDFHVVGVGASAGGLDACKRLLSALPGGHGMAFILVLHLDPTHESLMADLLAPHTSMVVQQAADGMPVEADHLYVIPPAFYLSVEAGHLGLSTPEAPHGARLPFDFLLKSLAGEYGAAAMGVVLSGTGTDGTIGLEAVRVKGGFTVAQDPKEADYDGMPRSAIGAGAVDLVAPVTEIPEALLARARQPADAPAPSALARIVALLRASTAFDFTLYKPGTLQRRTERRMALAAMGTGEMDRYLEVLRKDPVELDLLAKDLLINVTGFFRDPEVFTALEEKIIPDLVRDHPPGRPLRVWVPACSTGEEAYSLAMLFFEAIAALKRSVHVQIFASDVDPDAVAKAREGFYPDAVTESVSPGRLERFFVKDSGGFRVSADLRAAVVFTVQNVLADPPFSRLDMISCRNLLIYLTPEAQAKAISLFHFALLDNGLLLLGTSEEVNGGDLRFALLSKPLRLYRRVGQRRPGALPFPIGTKDGVYLPARPAKVATPSRQAAFAELCRQVVLDSYAPAAVLINRACECLYYLGSTDPYLRLVPGHPTQDLLSMAREGIRTKLRAAIHQASQDKKRVVVTGGRARRDGEPFSFSIAVHPLQSEGEDLLLVCFLDAATPGVTPAPSHPTRNVSRVTELERELETTRAELEGAIRNLELSSEEQKAVNEEALSVNEEFQSTNEELLASKEELQSLNEELTALNGQLQETLERQRTTSSDLQNVLYSTDVATLFLDTEMKIRFFTPATRALFNVIPSDVGRPLSDLNSLAADATLITDVKAVLSDQAAQEQEIETRDGAWYLRRILPYRTQAGGVDGVVITFVDVTERRRAADALETAKRDAELANSAKSRFLAAASHDLRQPLQSLVLLQGLLAKVSSGEKAERLVKRLDETISAMSGMLNALLDINQIEAGTIKAEIVTFPINDLLDRMREELTYHARGAKLSLSVIPCSLSVESDPRLLEQMLRNLISNALKYTPRGRVLVGCRRHGPWLRIEVWDTGIGIPETELRAIFDEYHQLHNPARERNLGLGLGLSIVQRLGRLLEHPVQVRSRPEHGSVFSIDVKRAPPAPERRVPTLPAPLSGKDAGSRKAAAVLVIEDDPDVRSLLELLLTTEGHAVTVAPDGDTAVALVERNAIRPELILADYNLPNGMTGLETASRLRARLGRRIPVVIVTGDISTTTLRDIAGQDCVQLNKPVKADELTLIIQRLLAARPSPMAQDAPSPPGEHAQAASPTVFIVDDDDLVRQGMRSVLEEDGRTVEDYDSCEAFIEAFGTGRPGCLLVDAYLPGMKGLDLLKHLQASGHGMAAIMITGNSDVRMAVEAMKAGAFDFIEKPVGRRDLLACVTQALDQAQNAQRPVWHAAAAEQLSSLTHRQREILDLVLAGHPSKNIAADLGISQRTVENHRAAIMKKTGAKSLPALARIALAATWTGSGEHFS